MKGMRNIRITTIPGFKTIATIALFGILFTTKIQAQNGGGVQETTTVTAKVTGINQTTRKVTLKTDDGKEYSFIAGDNVKNLAQVKKGDLITAVYTEAIAYQVRKHNKDTGVVVTNAVGAAPLGAKPAGAVVQQTTVAVTITAIDPTIPTVTFRGPQGNTKTIKVKDPQKLVGVKVGDVVDITYTEALAVKVDAAPAK
jgi:Cu/Ag efflux protein CusF